MKVKKKANKKSWLKKFFIKICRFFGYEIIDQNDFFLPVTGQKINEDLSIIGERSLTIPMGKVEITRPVRSLTIILRKSDFNLGKITWHSGSPILILYSIKNGSPFLIIKPT